MADFTQHITKEGERWDTIAYKAYGTVDDVNKPDGTSINALSYIIEANPTVPITATLPGGIRLLVPIVETVAVEVDETLLPPWK